MMAPAAAPSTPRSTTCAEAGVHSKTLLESRVRPVIKTVSMRMDVTKSLPLDLKERPSGMARETRRNHKIRELIRSVGKVECGSPFRQLRLALSVWSRIQAKF
jgi:hypothetical protein